MVQSSLWQIETYLTERRSHFSTSALTHILYSFYGKAASSSSAGLVSRDFHYQVEAIIHSQEHWLMLGQRG